MRRVFALGLALVLGCADAGSYTVRDRAARASVEVRPIPRDHPAPSFAIRSPDPARALERAGRLLRRAWEASDREAAALRAEAVEAYRAIRVDFPVHRAIGAEAAFRAGEILRAAGDSRAAQREFDAAIRLGSGTPFASRALLENGHLMRRSGQLEHALAAYAETVSRPDAPPTTVASALTWSAKLSASLGRFDEAEALWKRVENECEDPRTALRAFDAHAHAYIDRGDLEAAAGVLELGRQRVVEVARELTPNGERVRRALETSTARERLRRAIEERRRADIERSAQQVGPDLSWDDR